MSEDPRMFVEPNPKSPTDVNTIWFEETTEKNDTESDKQGMPVFDKVLLAHIVGPGMVKSEAVMVCERTTPDGKTVPNPQAQVRYGQMIRDYKSGEAGTSTGTPLTELAALDMAVRASLKAMGVHSIEALAGMNESAAPQFMGFRKFKTAAQAYIDQRDGQAPVAKLTAALEAERAARDTLQKNFDDLAARVAEMGEAAPEKRGPGRPRTIAAAA